MMAGRSRRLATGIPVRHRHDGARGRIVAYDRSIQLYRVAFEDGTEDWAAADDLAIARPARGHADKEAAA